MLVVICQMFCVHDFYISKLSSHSSLQRQHNFLHCDPTSQPSFCSSDPIGSLGKAFQVLPPISHDRSLFIWRPYFCNVTSAVRPLSRVCRIVGILASPSLNSWQFLPYLLIFFIALIFIWMTLLISSCTYFPCAPKGILEMIW